MMKLGGNEKAKLSAQKICFVEDQGIQAANLHLDGDDGGIQCVYTKYRLNKV